VKLNLKSTLLVSFLWACGGAPVKPLPAWYAVANADNPQYPRSRFLTGVGLSTSGADDADGRAKADLSAKISAQLQSETSSFEKYTTEGGSQIAATNRVSVRTSFDRADLIRIVDRSVQEKAFYSYAVLDRAACDRELLSAMSADLQAFTTSSDQAKIADALQQTGVFSTAASEASKLRTKLDAAFIVRRAVTGRPAVEEAAYVAQRNQLVAMVEEHRARQVVGVVLKSSPGAAKLSDFTVNAVKSLGLRPDSAACSSRAKSQLTDATELEVAPEETCNEGQLGEKCEVIVHLTALSCSGGAAGAGTIAMVRGVHPSDRDKARRSAWDKVTPASVETAVREALKSALKLGE
jgi:hypothetical protein